MSSRIATAQRVRSRLQTRLGDKARSFARHRLGTGPTTAFVLSGGGNLGAVQVGMLRALASAGVRPDLIVGCSVGAINGAAFAADPTLAGIDRLERIWQRMETGDPDLMPSTKLVPLVAQLARKGDALHDREPLESLLDDELPVRRFEQLAVPFHCVATDLGTANEFWMSEGRLVPSLLASAALPAVYPPLEYRNRTLIDGGVLREVHAHKAVEHGATEVYVLHVGHLDERSLETQRPFDSALRAYWTARRYRMEDDLRRIPEWVTVHRLPAGSTPRLRFDDFSQGSRLAELAYDASRQYLRTGVSPDPTVGPESMPLASDEEPGLAARAEPENDSPAT